MNWLLLPIRDFLVWMFENTLEPIGNNPNIIFLLLDIVLNCMGYLCFQDPIKTKIEESALGKIANLTNSNVGAMIDQAVSQIGSMKDKVKSATQGDATSSADQDTSDLLAQATQKAGA